MYNGIGMKIHLTRRYYVTINRIGSFHHIIIQKKTHSYQRLLLVPPSGKDLKRAALIKKGLIRNSYIQASKFCKRTLQLISHIKSVDSVTQYLIPKGHLDDFLSTPVSVTVSVRVYILRCVHQTASNMSFSFNNRNEFIKIPTNNFLQKLCENMSIVMNLNPIYLT